MYGKVVSVCDYGGSGLRGGVRGWVLVRVGIGEGIGHRMEQLLSLRNIPSLSDASSDWRIAGNLRGRVRSLLLSLL